MLPDYLTRYLSNPLICPRQDRLDAALGRKVQIGSAAA